MVREAISSRVGWRSSETGFADAAGGDAVGPGLPPSEVEAEFNRVEGAIEGSAETRVVVVLCFAGFSNAISTLRMWDLNLVRLRSNAALAWFC